MLILPFIRTIPPTKTIAITTIIPIPWGDEFSRDYDYIEEGTIARISKIYDENSVWNLNYAHPEPVYSFDEGESPLTFYQLRESSLKLLSELSIKKLENKLNSSKREGSVLEDIIKQIKK